MRSWASESQISQGCRVEGGELPIDGDGGADGGGFYFGQRDVEGTGGEGRGQLAFGLSHQDQGTGAAGDSEVGVESRSGRDLTEHGSG